MNNRKDTTRRDDITNVRALAIFLVVLGHSIILYSSAWGYYPTEQKSILLDNLKFLINGIQMGSAQRCGVRGGECPASALS